MATTHSTDQDSPFWTWLLPALTFLAGAVLASAAYFLVFDDGEDAVADDAVIGPSPTSGPDGEATATGDELVVQVPSQCVEAAESVGTVTTSLEQAVGAVRGFDAAELQQVFDVLEDLRPGLEQASQDCLAIAADAEIITPSLSPTPSPSQG